MNTITNTNTNTPSSSSTSSGWTLYLDHSTPFLTSPTKSHHLHSPQNTFYHHHHHHDQDDDDEEEEEEEEEDLSMVSDASSGPPHFHHNDHSDDLLCCANSTRKRPTTPLTHSNVKLGRRRFDPHHHDFALDDTASSHPIINLFFSSEKNGGVHCLENQDSPINSLLDYSSQGFSATHFQVVVDSRKRR